MATSEQDGEGLERVSRPTPVPQDVALPEGIKIIEAEPIVDRKSVFVGRACLISHPSQVCGALHLLRPWLMPSLPSITDSACLKLPDV